MNTGLYLAFLITAVALILVPGPTVMLITSKTLRNGVRSGFMTVAGCALAATGQLGVVVAGLASVVIFVSGWFEWIRWAGVAYLVLLGVREWRDAAAPDTNRAEHPAPVMRYRDFADGFVVTATNPKMLLFLGAFLPQFVDPAFPELPQLVILAVSFQVLAALLDVCWVVLTARVGRLFTGHRSRGIAGKVSGSVLILAAVSMALIRRAG